MAQTTITVTIEGADRLAKALGPGYLLEPELSAWLRNPVALQTERWAREGAPYDTGALKRSIVSEVRGLDAKVYSPLQYAVVMEEGRRAGSRMPPPTALEGWMRRHGISTSPYVIARAIARRGIKGRFFMRAAADRLRGDMPRLLDDLGRRISRRWSS